MSKKILKSAIILALTMLFCNSIISAQTRYKKFAFRDEFDKASNAPLDSSKWTAEIGGYGWGNEELQYYTDDIENVYHDGAGLLVIMTAIDIATEALDRLHTTAESHNRVMILEVMGRNTGWIALHAGLTGSADVILIPEIPFVLEKVVEAVKARDASGSRFTNIVVAEGSKELGGKEIYLESSRATKVKRLGGIGELLRRQIEEATGKESRTVVLGHLHHFDIIQT